MNKKVTISEENIFADLGLEDSEEMRARSDLLSEIVHIIRNSKLPNKDFAAILGISQPKVSSLIAGKINDFSTDTLMQYLTKLGCNVEIRVQPRRHLSKSVQKGSMTVRKRTIQTRKNVRNTRRKLTTKASR